MVSSTISNDRHQESQISVMNLKFLNKNLEMEYSEIELQNTIQHNKSVTFLSISLAIITLIYVLLVQFLEKNYFDQKNITIETLTNKTFINEINNNKTAIAPEFLFYNKFILINDTKFNSGNFSKEESLLSNKDQDLLFVVGSLWFLPVAIFQTLFVLTLFLVFLGVLCISKKNLGQKILCCLINTFFSQSFHMNSGMLIVHFRVPPESIFFIVALHLMIKTFLTYKYKTKWSIFALGTILGNIFECAVYLSIITLNQVLLFYLIVNCAVHIVIVGISYLNELNYRKEFLLRRNLRKEINYANDILYNMNQGFITYNKELLFINKSMKRILNYFNSYSSDSKDICFTLPESFQSNSNDKIFSKVNKYPVKATESQEELCKKIHPKFEGRILETNVTPNTKFLIERLFSNITEFSSELPNEILDKIHSKFSDLKTNFNLDKFYTLVKENEVIFSSFTYFGIISLICPQDRFPNKKFQVMLRVLQSDNQENYLEFMLNDASELVQNEREEAIVNSRSTYLSKIAHEFKNPISSIMELSTKISEQSKENNQINQNKSNSQIPNTIKSNASYINKLCKLMIQFLKDYSLFTSLTFKCDNCIERKFNNCKICCSKNLCEKCNICKNCEEKNDSTFDSIKLIKDILKFYKSLGRHEKKEGAPVFEEVYKTKKSTSSKFSLDYLIKTNKEILFSALHNIIFYAYKSSLNKAKIRININKKHFEDHPQSSVTQFEISINTLLIDSNFLDNLYSNQVFKADTLKNRTTFASNSVYQDNSSDIYSKYFEIYVSFYMIRKLGSQLRIHSTREETKFSFEIINFNNFNNFDSQTEILPEMNTAKINESYFDSPNSHTSLQICNLESLENTKIYDDAMKFNYNNLSENFKYEVLVLPQLDNNISNRISCKFGKEMHQDSSLLPENSNLISNGQDLDMKKIRVLVLDDEALIRSTLKRHFNKITKKNPKFLFETTEASNCFQALQILYDNYNENILFDFIIIDEYMPNMKGSTLIKLLKQISSENNFYNINIISHTAFDSNEKRQFILDSGADYILGKPVVLADLEDLVLKVIKS